MCNPINVAPFTWFLKDIHDCIYTEKCKIDETKHESKDVVCFKHDDDDADDDEDKEDDEYTIILIKVPLYVENRFDYIKISLNVKRIVRD
jgi:hypothetical protein